MQEGQALLVEGLTDAALFGGGVGNALGNNLTLGVVPRGDLSAPAFVYGQQVGDGLSMAVGAAEVAAGGGMMGGSGLMMVTSGGTLVPVGAPLAAEGAAIAGHGSVVMSKALLEFAKHKEGKHEGRLVKKGGKGAASYKFPGKKELAKRLNIHPDQVHSTKDRITKYFKEVLRKKNFKNPDIGVDHLGNIVFKHPVNKKTIATKVPLSDFGL